VADGSAPSSSKGEHDSSYGLSNEEWLRFLRLTCSLMVPKLNGLVVALSANVTPFFRGVPSKLEHIEYGDPATGCSSLKSFRKISGISGRSLGRDSSVNYIES
jgi:hypothetical protein